jgi:phenylalanyl-tRNA synthetase beta chain
MMRGREELPEESQHLGIAVAGLMTQGRWMVSRELERWDFYALKGIVEDLLQAVARTSSEFAAESHPALQPGRAACITLSSKAIGYMGEVRPEVREAYALPDPVFVAELDVERLAELAAAEPKYQPVSRFPGVSRDVAFLLPKDIPAKKAEIVIRQVAGGDLESLSLFDAYEGSPLPQGQRNLAFSLAFRHRERTLTDEEVDESMERIRKGLREQLGAHIRE